MPDYSTIVSASVFFPIEGNLYSRSDPTSDFSFYPANGARTERYWFRKAAILNVLVQSAAGKSGALLDLPASQYH